MVEANGETVPYREVGPRLANEPDRERRRRLHAARRAVTAESLNPVYEQMAERRRKLAGRLGAGSVLELYEGFGYDPRRLAAATSSFLAATDAVRPAPSGVRVRLLLRESRSLKDKRQVVKSIKDRLRNSFNVSVAEVDAQDNRQLAILGFAMVSNETSHVKGAFDQIVAALRGHPVAEFLDHEADV